MKRWLPVLAVVVGLTVSLLVAEFAFALIVPQPTYRRVLRDNPAMHVTDPVIAHALRPTFAGSFRTHEFDTRITIDTHGFRGRGPGGRPAIVFIGDSFTFGHGVNDKEAYPAIVDSLLPEDVLNLGFAAGSSPDMYYAWLAAGNPTFEVRQIVIGFFVGNDIDGHPEMVWAAVDEHGLPMRIENTESHVVEGRLQARTTPIGYRYPVLRHSHLFHLAGRAYRNLQVMRSPPTPAPSVFDAEWTAETHYQVARTESAFRGIARTLGERGIPLSVVMIPTLQQVTGQAPTRVQQHFSILFAELGVPHLDLVPALKADDYFPLDQHWNADGHRAAAIAVAAWLTR